MINRNSNNIEKIIRHNISESNNIITDDFSSYNWLNSRNSGYNHIIHIHVQYDFGYGIESTSYIHSVLADLKRMLSRFYIAVKSKSFILFEKECEWRKKVTSLYNLNK